MTNDLMRKLEQVAHARRAWFEAEDGDQIGYVVFNQGEIEYYAKVEGSRYVVCTAERGCSSAEADVADMDHAVLLIGLLMDRGTGHRPDELVNVVHVIEGDPSISDEELAAIIDRHIESRFYSLGAACNVNSVWLRVGERSHDVMYRDVTGSDGVILSDSVTDAYNMHAYDVAVVCNYAWNLQYAWRRILDWGFQTDDPELTPILRRVLDVEAPLAA